MLINELKPQKTTDVRLDGKVCVVTGANTGVGYQAATSLLERGAHVVMVCRNERRGLPAKEKLEKLGTGSVDLVCGDLSSMQSVEQVAATLLERYPQIHVLINNAGLHTTTRKLTDEGHELTFAVNHLATFLLTMRLLERIKASAPARIIHVSSQGHRFGGLDLNDLTWDKRVFRGLKAYGASKTANLFFTGMLAEQLQGTRVTVNAVHPGGVKTDIGRDNGRLWKAFHENVVSRMLRDPRMSGEALYYHAAAPELASVSGRFFNLTHQEAPHTHAQLRPNRAWAETVWLLSERLTGLAKPVPRETAATKPASSEARA